MAFSTSMKCASGAQMRAALSVRGWAGANPGGGRVAVAGGDHPDRWPARRHALGSIEFAARQQPECGASAAACAPLPLFAIAALLPEWAGERREARHLWHGCGAQWPARSRAAAQQSAAATGDVWVAWNAAIGGNGPLAPTRQLANRKRITS